MKYKPNLMGYELTDDGLGVIGPKGNPIKLFMNRGGYWAFAMGIVGSKTKRTTMYFHRFIALKYMDNPYNKPCVNHIDGDRLNNCPTNLEWCTYAENTHHAYVFGLVKHTHPFKKVAVKGTHAQTGETIYLDSMTGNKNFKGSAISNCCAGINKTHRGYVWEKI